METSSGGMLSGRYLIILATVFNLLRQHKVQIKYIFVFTKEWHEKAPINGAEVFSKGTYPACLAGWESAHRGSDGEKRAHSLERALDDVRAYASDKFHSHERRPLNENFAANPARVAASA